MVQLTTLVAFAYAFAAVAAAPLKRTLAEVQYDISWMASESSEFVWTLQTFGPNPPGGPPTPLYVHNGAINLEYTYNASVPVALGTPAFSQSDAKSILSSLQTDVVQVQTTMTELLIEYKPIFETYTDNDWPAIYLQDQYDMKATMIPYWNAIISRLPVNLVTRGKHLKAAALANFDTAIAAYQ